MSDAVLVLDCGATNVRAVGVSATGAILGQCSFPNAARPDPEDPAGRIWDHEAMWGDLTRAARTVTDLAGSARFGAVTLTTFGVDGTLVDPAGHPLHPVISWQCGRTRSVLEAVEARVPAQRLFARSGVQPLAMNTLYKLAWFQEHRPELLARARAWLFLGDLFHLRMTGAYASDVTLAGTSMLTDLRTRTWSEATLAELGLAPGLFQPLAEPGSIRGELLPEPARALGLRSGLPVVSAGHDTQFALFGSGAGEGQAVLSSGTWEILLARTPHLEDLVSLRAAGLTVELDAQPGLYDPGLMWVASGLVEWLKNLAFAQEPEPLATMALEAGVEAPGAGGPAFRGDFLDQRGLLSGLGVGTRRGQLARALFEALAFKTRHALAVLEAQGGFRSPTLTVVGGGGQNLLWNQIRADVLERDVQVIDRKEVTALGAAFHALPALGHARNPEAARAGAAITARTFRPGTEAASYRKLCEAD